MNLNFLLKKSKYDDREIWINILLKIANPVLVNIANGTFKKNMAVDCIKQTKIRFSYLEAVSRLICGIAPWLELGLDNTDEGKLRGNCIDLVVKGLVNICNPESDDYLLFDDVEGDVGQPLVDVAFLAEGILRAKNQIWGNIDEYGQNLIIEAFKKTRSIIPGNNNWLLFASMVEVFLLETTGEYNEYRLMKGVNKFLNEWYVGDGQYGDGQYYHFDYYNSFVIHPMLTDILYILAKHNIVDKNILNIQLRRLKQYSGQLERLISPEGTYPIIGRSMTYRTGIFHALAQASLLGVYDDEVNPAQVRTALTKVIKKQFSSNDNFDEGGWLKIGFNGSQLKISEEYITTGSLYLCSTVFLPLGLPKDNEFWANPDEDWTSLKGWNGKDIAPAKPIND